MNKTSEFFMRLGFLFAISVGFACGEVIAGDETNGGRQPAGAEVYAETERQDKVHVPKDYDSEKQYPFILSLHGYGSNGRGQLMFFPLKQQLTIISTTVCIMC